MAVSALSAEIGRRVFPTVCSSVVFKWSQPVRVWNRRHLLSPVLWLPCLDSLCRITPGLDLEFSTFALLIHTSLPPSPPSSVSGVLLSLRFLVLNGSEVSVVDPIVRVLVWCMYVFLHS